MGICWLCLVLFTALLRLNHYLDFIDPIEISRQQAIWLDVLSIIRLIVLNAMLWNYFFITWKSRVLSEGRSIKARTRELEKHNRTLERNSLSVMESVKKISHDINISLNVLFLW